MTRPARQGEGALSDAIVATLEALGVRVFRNSQAAMRRGARVYRGGLGNGSADLVGVLNVRAFEKIEDRGFAPLHMGRFVAFEVKMPGKIPTAERIDQIRAKGDYLRSKDDARDLSQWDWLAGVRDYGGFACYLDSPESARAAIARARTGASS